MPADLPVVRPADVRRDFTRAEGDLPPRRYYKCSGKDCTCSARERRCPQRMAEANSLKAAVWGHVDGLLRDPEALLAQFQDMARLAADGEVDGREEDLNFEAQLRRLEREEGRLLDAYQAEVISLEELGQRRGGVITRRRALTEQRDRQEQEKLTLEDFELDEHGLVVRCPQGHAPVTTSASADKLQVCFEEATCAACPFHKSCCASAVGRKESRYQYTYDRVIQRLRRLHNHSDEFKERYRWRSGIEGTMSRFKYQMRMASLRIRGRAAVS